MLGSAELTELISAFKKRPLDTAIVYPEVFGKRGNPVVFSGEIIAELMATNQKIGCRKFIDDHPALVHKHITENDRFTLDIDTPEDLATFEKRTGWKLTMPLCTES